MSVSEVYRAMNMTITGGVSPEVRSKSGVGTSVESPSAKPGAKSPGVENEFDKILREESNRLNISQHAETRIKSRDIPWSPELEMRIQKGMDQAESKGSREALILAGDVAVIANVKSRTVVTAMDREQLKDRIFTNIDSTVLV